jgi:modulator of FtsH protease
MTPYSIAGWENFLVAQVGAAAALVGLVFVAISINLARIISLPLIPGRAGETLFFLFSVLAVASCGLIPGQPISWFGGELLVIAGVTWAIVTVRWLRVYRKRTKEPLQWLIPWFLIGQISTLPFAVAGVSILARRGGGLYWLVPGVILAFGGGIFNAWVLLVEILR